MINVKMMSGCMVEVSEYIALVSEYMLLVSEYIGVGVGGGL